MSKWARKRDANEGEVVKALLAVGAHVAKLDGSGIPDLLVLYQGQLHLLEVKHTDGASFVQRHGKTAPREAGLTAAQVKWWDEWGDPKPAIVTTVDEALAAIGAKR